MFGNLCVIQSVHNQVLLVSVFYRINIQKIPKKYTKDTKTTKKYTKHTKNTKKYTKDTKKIQKNIQKIQKI